MSDGHLYFVHRFNSKLQCTARVRDERPADSELCLNLGFEWLGRPKPKQIAEYRQWILGVVQSLADRWNTSILYALGTRRNQTELWRVAAGEAPRLLEKLKVGIP
jgi:hypothetical protein